MEHSAFTPNDAELFSTFQSNIMEVATENVKEISQNRQQKLFDLQKGIKK